MPSLIANWQQYGKKEEKELTHQIIGVSRLEVLSVKYLLSYWSIAIKNGTIHKYLISKAVSGMDAVPVMEFTFLNKHR